MDVVFWTGAIGSMLGYRAWLVWLAVLARRRAGAIGRGSILDGL
jgi:hypothetical protein